MGKVAEPSFKMFFTTYLGLASYVEQFCTFIGIVAPDLTPTQQNMAITQRAGSLVCEHCKLFIFKY